MTSTVETAWALIVLDFRTVSGGKGATSTAKGQNAADQAMYTKAFNFQQSQLHALSNAFSPYLAGKTGYDPAALSGMRSAFLNSNNQTFNQAGQQVREALGLRGNTGQNPVGGDYASGISNLLGAKAGSQSQGLLGIQVQNAMQALNNQFNAGNLMSGNAATLTGTQGVAGNAASSALNSYINASNSGFLGSFQNALGGTLGKGLGVGLTGGLGGMMSGGGGFGAGFRAGG